MESKYSSPKSNRRLSQLSDFLFLRGMSLRTRLGLIFSGLMVLAILFASLALYRYHQLAVHGAKVAVQQQSELEKSIQLQERLNEIERFAERGEISPESISAFRRGLARLRGDGDSREAVELEQAAAERFESFVTALQKSPRDANETRSRYQDAAAAVASLIEMNQMGVYRMAHNLGEEQAASMRVALFLVALFLLLLMVGALKIISSVTQPLSTLARFLDEVNVEDDLPYNLPQFEWEVPEVSQVARSFEQLLYRLRGYRALNVRRLLIEKRRADIVAASISDGIFLMRGGEILYVNPVGERILGLPRDKTWKGLSVNSSEYPRNSGVGAVFKAITRTIPVEFELEVDQRKEYYLLQSYPISDKVIEEVEHSFHGPMEQLLDRWQASTLVLAQNVTLVRESQEAKSHFIATLSHEVKTPVTSLTMATRLLKKGIEQIPNATHRSLIETCAQDVDRLRGLIEDLLTVSRFDTLTQRPNLQNVDLGKLLKQSVQFFQPQAFERGIEMKTQVNTSGTPIHVPMDATKISWAMSNLLTNALRHTPQGGKVEASVCVDGEFAEIRIRDTGPGIDRNRQERIFDKFNPFYDLRVARSGSVGMGLAIAREIIVAHGGRIWVTSEPGAGAEFCFTLPLKRASESQVAVAESAEAAKTGLTASNMNSVSIMKGDNSGSSARS